MDSYNTGAPYRINLHVKLIENDTKQRVFLWKNDTPSTLLIFNADKATRTNSNVTNTTNNNSTNTTNNNSININQTQNPLINNKLCHEQKLGVCAVYCNYKCSTCSSDDPY